MQNTRLSPYFTVLAVLLMAAVAFISRPDYLLMPWALWLLILGAAALWLAKSFSPPSHSAGSGDGTFYTGQILSGKSGVTRLVPPLHEMGDRRKSLWERGSGGGDRQTIKTVALSNSDGAGRGISISSPSLTRIKVCRFPLVLGLLSLALLSLFNTFPLGVSVHIQFILLCHGAALIAWGLATPSQTRLVPSTGRRYPLLLLAILLLALFLRLWMLNDAIHHTVDEMNFMYGITQLWDEPDIGLLQPFHTVTAFTSVYPYLEAHIVNIFHPSLGSLRILSALVGTLNVLALYFLARVLFDEKTALIAALVLATFPPHIHFSRIGLNNVADPMLATFAFAFLVHGLKSAHQTDFALAGITLGLTQYFYEGGKLLFPALTLIWLITGVIFWRGHLRGRWRGLLVMLLAAFIIAAPVYITLIGSRESAAPRMDTMSLTLDYWGVFFRAIPSGDIFPEEILHILQPFLVYTHLPEQGWFYGANTPLILWYLVPAFYLGFFHLGFRWRSPAASLLLLWIFLTSFGNILLQDSGLYARYVVAFPALALFIAVGINHIWTSLVGAGLRPAHLKPARLIPTPRIPFLTPHRIGILLLLSLTLAQSVYYFRDHIPQFNREHPPGRDLDDPYFRAMYYHFPPGTYIHIIDEIFPWDFNTLTTLRFFDLDLKVDYTFPYEFDAVYAARLPFGVDHAFFIRPDDEQTLARLRQHFYLRPAQYSPFNVPIEKQYVLYYAPYIPGFSEKIR